jgi:hypothetical protein
LYTEISAGDDGMVAAGLVAGGALGRDADRAGAWRLAAQKARSDGFRQPGRIAQLVLVCEADKRGRAGLAGCDYPQGPELLRLHDAALSVRGGDLADSGLTGPALGAALRDARIQAIARARTVARA